MVSEKTTRAPINILMDSFAEGMSHISSHTHSGELTCNPLGGEEARVRGRGKEEMEVVFITHHSFEDKKKC